MLAAELEFEIRQNEFQRRVEEPGEVEKKEHML